MRIEIGFQPQPTVRLLILHSPAIRYSATSSVEVFPIRYSTSPLLLNSNPSPAPRSLLLPAGCAIHLERYNSPANARCNTA